MIILISLIALLSIGMYVSHISRDYYYDRYFMSGVVITTIAGIYLLIHVLLWSIASYEYNSFIAKREAFIETLQEARKNNNELELAAITKDISEWNQYLSAQKYNLKVFLIKDYTDKRFHKVEPIK